MSKLNALIAGSPGYIGIQLIKLLIKHKNINIKYLCGNSSVGKNISSYDNSFRSKKLPRITKYNKKNLSTNYRILRECEAILICLPTPLKNSKPDMSYIFWLC